MWFVRRALPLFALCVGVLAGGAARANPRPLPMTYQSESLAAGAGELEQFVDFSPLKALSTQDGHPVTYNATQFQTEFEYGVTSKLEVAFYLTFVPQPGDALSSLPVLQIGNGAAQRVRYRLNDVDTWPVDVAFYGEVTENERELELEAKVILQRRIGGLRLITNLWGEREFYFDGRREWVINPTLGATYEISPRFHVGTEGWVRSEYLDGASGPRAFNMGPQVFAGPAFMVDFGRIWWSTGAYLRFNDWSRATQPGDSYGHVWVRTVVGLGF